MPSPPPLPSPTSLHPWPALPLPSHPTPFPFPLPIGFSLIPANKPVYCLLNKLWYSLPSDAFAFKSNQHCANKNNTGQRHRKITFMSTLSVHYNANKKLLLSKERANIADHCWSSCHPWACSISTIDLGPEIRGGHAGLVSAGVPFLTPPPTSQCHCPASSCLPAFLPGFLILAGERLTFCFWAVLLQNPSSQVFKWLSHLCYFAAFSLWGGLQSVSLDMVSEVQVCVWDGGECPWEQPPYGVKEAGLVQLRTRRNPGLWAVHGLAGTS